ncbi:hypothetical protein [Kineococcus sp. SYSU DK018]|uniref:hypothetical protein n=1 Tax=Kineococcus sp. SYSU DK018 TaxID=3383139 RepID=UPI003D7EA626
MSTPREPRRDLHRDRDLDAVLRSLDAAGPASSTLNTAQRQRAHHTLEAIVASPPLPSSSPAAGSSRARAVGASSRPPRPRSRPRRLLLFGAAVAAGVVSVSVFDGGSGERMAFASWTPTPTPLSEQEVELIGPTCRDKLEGGALDLDRARLQLAERRGDVVALLYWTPDPDMSGHCLARNVAGTDDVEVITAGTGGGDMPALQAPAGGYTRGAISQSTISDAERVSITSGAAGTDVAGVTIHAGSYTVQATVRQGRYVAWWPGPAFRDETAAPSGRDRSTLLLTYDLTLSDGTVIRDATGTLPT